MVKQFNLCVVQQTQGKAAARLAVAASNATRLVMCWCWFSAAYNLRMQLALHPGYVE
jgi:hypothetical protein